MTLSLYAAFNTRTGKVLGKTATGHTSAEFVAFHRRQSVARQVDPRHGGQSLIRPRLEALVAQDRDLLKALVKEALDQILQAEMTQQLGAEPGERSATRTGYRAGYYEPGLVTRVGRIELRAV